VTALRCIGPVAKAVYEPTLFRRAAHQYSTVPYLCVVDIDNDSSDHGSGPRGVLRRRPVGLRVRPASQDVTMSYQLYGEW
jgi:hypothetical protein